MVIKLTTIIKSTIRQCMNNKNTTNKFNIDYNLHMSDVKYNNGFRKEGLDTLKARYKFTTQEFIQAKYPKKEWANMEVKISRLINRPIDAKGYFGASQLAGDLSEFIKDKIDPKIKNGDSEVAPSFFLGNAAYIDVVGGVFKNGQIRLFEKKEVKKCAVPIRYNGCQGIITRTPSSNGLIRIFRPKNYIYTGADGRFGICQDKKTKVIYIGYLVPNSNGNYDIEDRSWSTGIPNEKNLADDISISWSSRIEGELYPTFWDY